MNFFLTAGLAEAIQIGIMGLLLAIDSLVYWVISILFSLYEELATFQFLTADIYEQITNRIYIVIGVVMLFYLAYALLKSLVNPDELTKVTSKIVSNIVISLVLINIIPYVFGYAYEIQNIILKEDNIVGKLVLGNANSNIGSQGRATAMTFLEAFFRPKEGVEIKDGENRYAEWEDLKICILDNKTTGCKGDENFKNITALADSVVAGDTEYTFLISTACGIFLLYIIASFCIDLGVRVVKLAFYQIIAPIPIIMRIIPEKKSVFDNWVKATIATYLEVFIRLTIMYITVFFATLIPDLMSDAFSGDLGLYGVVIVLMGVFAFAKQAPKLIGDVIGVDGGNIKLGIKDKLAVGGGLALGAAVGGGFTAGLRNFTHGTKGAFSGVNKSNDWKTNAKGIGKGLLKTVGASASMVGGAASGAVRSGHSGLSAKNYRDVQRSASSGVAAAIEKRDKRAAYKAGHGNTFDVFKGHAYDKFQDAKHFAGIESIVDRVKFEEKFINQFEDYKNIYETGEYKAIESRINELKAGKAAGASAASYGIDTTAGDSFESVIKRLENQLQDKRKSALRRKNDAGEYIYKDAAAYMIYNLANQIQTNPALANEIGLDKTLTETLSKDITIRGNKIFEGDTELDMDRIVDILENSRDVTDKQGNVIGRAGLYADRGEALGAKKADTSTVEYKEFKRKQEEKK